MRMQITAWLVRAAVLVLIAIGFIGHVGTARTAGHRMPPLKPQPGPDAVVHEHLDALNHCDWARLIAQFPPQAEFFLPGGQLVKGREQIGQLFANLVKPFDKGGLCGVNFEAEHAFLVGDTLNVQWRADAKFLARSYRGADAYVTKDGLMWAMVTTFQKDQLKAK